MTIRIPFIKGHMGGNEIVLLKGNSVPVGRELEIGLRALYPTSIKGHEAGLFYYDGEHNSIPVKIIGGISKQFISMCGGLTQVIGKVMMNADLARQFGLPSISYNSPVTLETAAGHVNITLEIDDSGSEFIATDMTAFVKECYAFGIESFDVFGVPVMRIGKFLVANADTINKVYPNINLEHIDSSAIHTLRNMQEEFNKLRFPNAPTANFAVYDLNPVDPKHTGRVIFPHALSSGHIEPACGTGTVAIGLALAKQRRINDSGRDHLLLLFESGGSASQIGGPELTSLEMMLTKETVLSASFKHSQVEITATGELWV